MELPPPPLEIAPGKTISVLSISLLTEDHLRLREILGRSDFAYVLTQADTFRSAATALARQRFGVVLAEYDLCPNSWTDVLAITSDLTFSPSLIVTSRLADERRWAEALNLGAYDLLAKPFDDEEVLRVVNGAWHHCCEQQERCANTPQLYRNASGL